MCSHAAGLARLQFCDEDCPARPASGPEVAAVGVCSLWCGQHRQGGRGASSPLSGTGAQLGAVTVTAWTLHFFFDVLVLH